MIQDLILYLPFAWVILICIKEAVNLTPRPYRLSEPKRSKPDIPEHKVPEEYKATDNMSIGLNVPIPALRTRGEKDGRQDQ